MSTEPHKRREADIRFGQQLLRVLSFMAGLLSIPIATYFPLLYVLSELNEARSARAWGGSPLFGGTVAVLFAVAFAGVVGLVAYHLFRFAIRGPKQTAR